VNVVVLELDLKRVCTTDSGGKLKARSTCRGFLGQLKKKNLQTREIRRLHQVNSTEYESRSCKDLVHTAQQARVRDGCLLVPGVAWRILVRSWATAPFVYLALFWQLRRE
jgi:hypothetical protein